MIFERLVVGQFQTNCYILAKKQNSSQAIIIDPGDEPEKILLLLKRLNLSPEVIINTHGHIDHLAYDDYFAVPVYIHRLDAKCLTNPELNLSTFLGRAKKISVKTKLLEDGDILNIAGFQIEVLHTPGHTPGGISLFLKEQNKYILFSGDTLFWHSIGRTDFPNANERELVSSIKNKLLVLPDETVVYPGHGPTTTIAEEKRKNPFLS